MYRKILSDELKSDPLGRGYEFMSASEIITSLLNVDREVFLPIPSDDLLGWAAANGRYIKIKRVAEDDSLSDEIRSIAWGAMTLLDRDGISLDLNDSSIVAMIDALILAGVFVEAEKQELFALSATQMSRAIELGIPTSLQLDFIEKVRTL
tara:strand:- start:47 stop:499 length:453 start_codon:yes stop_codon:yes gene_type:complete